MWNDVVDLRDFYASGLGELAKRIIRRRVRAVWPSVKGERLLGLGYAVPYLRQFQDEAERVMAIMPAAQGVLHWPSDGPSRVALSDEAQLPLPDVSVDRVLLVHALECSEQMRAMMREVWRVLTPSGRVLVVVPNRRGIWARIERTPFGHGQPYTVSQASRLLRESMFTPLAHGGALFAPPWRIRMLLGSAAAWERIGARWFPRFAGVVFVEARKEIYAGTPVRARRFQRAFAPALPALPVRREELSAGDSAAPSAPSPPSPMRGRGK